MLGAALLAGPARADPPQLTEGPTIPAVPGQTFDGDPSNPPVPGGAPAVPSTLLGSERDLNIPLPALDAATLTSVLGVSSVADTYQGTCFDVLRPFAGHDGCLNTGLEIDTSNGYSLTETVIVNPTRVDGGSVSATVRLGGTGAVLGSATAADAATAQAQAIAQSSLGGLHGRVLPPIVTSTVVETASDTITHVLTGRDSYFYVQTTIGSAIVRTGNLGRCDHPNGTCEGGIPVYSATGAILVNSGTFTDLYVTTTIDRTITDTGELTLTVPVAAMGYAHPSAQTLAFDLSGRFLDRLRAGGGDGSAALGGGGRVRMFLEGTGSTIDYDRIGAMPGAHASFAGGRGGLAFDAGAGVTIALAGEGGSARWRLDDDELPERLRDSSWRAGAALNWRPGAWRLALVGFWGRDRIASTASSIYGAGTSTARYAADTFGAGASLGYAAPVGAFMLTPELGIDWLGWRSPATQETGGLAPLTLAAAHRDQERPWAGLAADYRRGPLSFGASARAVLTLGDRRGRVTAFDGLSSASSFTIDGAATGRFGAELGGHLDYAVSPGVGIGISGASRLSGGGIDTSGQAGLRIAF